MTKQSKPKKQPRKSKGRVTLSWDDYTIAAASEQAQRFPFNGNVSAYTRALVKRDKESPKTAIFMTADEKATFELFRQSQQEEMRKRAAGETSSGE